MRDDHGQLPITIDATSHGAFLPIPIGRTVAQAKALAAARITANARRLNLSRRTFLTSLSGVATTLLTLHHARRHTHSSAPAAEALQHATEKLARFRDVAVAQAEGYVHDDSHERSK